MGKKILIVDDDLDYIEAVQNLLEANGYTVIAESDGRKGFAQAKAHRPDLMLLDVMMPQSDGFDIARELHQEPTTQSIPVIMVTGIRRAMGPAFKFEPDEVWLPVKAVLEKPIKPEVLLKTVADNI